MTNNMILIHINASFLTYQQLPFFFLSLCLMVAIVLNIVHGSSFYLLPSSVSHRGKQVYFPYQPS